MTNRYVMVYMKLNRYTPRYTGLRSARTLRYAGGATRTMRRTTRRKYGARARGSYRRRGIDSGELKMISQRFQEGLQFETVRAPTGVSAGLPSTVGVNWSVNAPAATPGHEGHCLTQTATGATVENRIGNRITLVGLEIRGTLLSPRYLRDSDSGPAPIDGTNNPYSRMCWILAVVRDKRVNNAQLTVRADDIWDIDNKTPSVIAHRRTDTIAQYDVVATRRYTTDNDQPQITFQMKVPLKSKTLVYQNALANSPANGHLYFVILGYSQGTDLPTEGGEIVQPLITTHSRLTFRG